MIAIPNMKMPHNCIECPRLKWHTDEDGFDRSCCQEKVLYPSTIDRPTDCPLIDIDESDTELLEFFNEFKKWKASKEVAKYINAVYGERRE